MAHLKTYQICFLRIKNDMNLICQCHFQQYTIARINHTTLLLPHNIITDFIVNHNDYHIIHDKKIIEFVLHHFIERVRIVSPCFMNKPTLLVTVFMSLEEELLQGMVTCGTFSEVFRK
jgi:hypothetical protein